MDDINSIIAKKVHDGSYFQDAMLWYLDKYNNTRSHIILLSIYVCCALIALLVVALSVYQYFPLEKQYNFINHVPENADKAYSVKEMEYGANNNSSNITLAKHLIKEYVIVRESYDWKSYLSKEPIEYIKNNTIKRAYHDFVRMVRPSNPESSIRQLGKKFISQTHVTDVQISDNTKYAEVHFTVHKIGAYNNQLYDSTSYIAKIDFIMSNIEKFDYGQDKFVFRILNYKLYNQETGGNNEQ